MQIHLICVGQRMPGWVRQGYDEYAKRLPRGCALALREIAAAKRGKNADSARAIADEGARMVAALPAAAHVVALEVGGQPWSTAQLAAAMRDWLVGGQDVALLVGGPDGLAACASQRAHQSWSLSNLTFPHPLVRVIVAEQLYRAHSLLHNHPYHRC